MTTLVAAILLLAADVPISTHEPMEPRGELEIYDSMTQNGTVARREVRDADGLLVESAYYQLRPRADVGRVVGRNAILKGVTEEMLALSAMMHMRYDGRRLILQETFEGCHLAHTRHIMYDPVTGEKARELSIWFERDGGSRTIETFKEGRSHARYDCSTGGDVAYVTGHVPAEYDPPGGYGRSVNGVALRLVAERQAAELYLTLTARNLGAGSADRPSQPKNPVEVRDRTGRIVPMLPWRLEPKDGTISDCDGSSLEPEAAVWVMHWNVEETWGALTPGTYTAVATCCLPGRGEGAIKSNVMEFTITAP